MMRETPRTQQGWFMMCLDAKLARFVSPHLKANPNSR